MTNISNPYYIITNLPVTILSFKKYLQLFSYICCLEKIATPESGSQFNSYGQGTCDRESLLYYSEKAGGQAEPVMAL